MRGQEFKKECGMHHLPRDNQQKAAGELLSSLDLVAMVTEEKSSIFKFEKLLQLLHNAKWCTTTQCDQLLSEYKHFLSQMIQHNKAYFLDFVHKGDSCRVDEFLGRFVSGRAEYENSWYLLKCLITLSHGQAAVERGYSVNKDMLVENLKERTLISLYLVQDSLAGRPMEDAIHREEQSTAEAVLQEMDNISSIRQNREVERLRMWTDTELENMDMYSRVKRRRKSLRRSTSGIQPHHEVMSEAEGDEGGTEESHDEEEDDEEGDEVEEAEEENDRPYNLRQRKTVQRYQAPPTGRDPIGERTQPHPGYVRFDSVGGLAHHIQALKEMVVFPLLYPEVFERFKIQPPRGCLFYGPPGTGKTLVARALANECSQGDRKVAFFMRKGADCLSKWVGESERQLRLLFDQRFVYLVCAALLSLEVLAPAVPPPPRQLSEEEQKRLEDQEETTLRELRLFLRDVTKRLANDKRFNIFSKPVDVEEVSDYLEVIKQPMDLSKIMTKIDTHKYFTGMEFLADIDLISGNALEYNPDKDPGDKIIRHRACTLKDTAHAMFAAELDPEFNRMCDEIKESRKKRGKCLCSKYCQNLKSRAINQF
ncbi:UNVERIFIED_CONTAM: hypothetical protein FKN15_000862 [Acipenser sinensis]